MNRFPSILVLVVVVAIVWLVFSYNRLVKNRNQMREGWSGIEVQLKRRHDLVPALVQCVKGYQSHERELLEAVTRERSAAQAAHGPAQALGAEKALAHDLGRLIALAENYPDLKADQSFRDLMGQLVEIEDQIQYARRYYNGSVRDLNNAIESFPTNLIAQAFSFRTADFFEVTNASERIPPDLAPSLNPQT